MLTTLHKPVTDSKEILMDLLHPSPEYRVRNPTTALTCSKLLRHSWFDEIPNRKEQLRENEDRRTIKLYEILDFPDCVNDPRISKDEIYGRCMQSEYYCKVQAEKLQKTHDFGPKVDRRDSGLDVPTTPQNASTQTEDQIVSPTMHDANVGTSVAQQDVQIQAMVETKEIQVDAVVAMKDAQVQVQPSMKCIEIQTDVTEVEDKSIQTPKVNILTDDELLALIEEAKQEGMRMEKQRRLEKMNPIVRKCKNAWKKAKKIAKKLF
jgi:hypothetical protein